MRLPGPGAVGGGRTGLPAVSPAPAASPGSDIIVLGRGRLPAMAGAPPEDVAGEASGSMGDRPPAVLNLVHPTYPLAARRDNIEGVVVVRIWVSATGDVTRVQVLRASPPGYFESAAVDAVRQWRFTPALRQDRPVAAVVASYTLRFSLLDADD